jgi:hypothetical protein
MQNDIMDGTATSAWQLISNYGRWWSSNSAADDNDNDNNNQQMFGFGGRGGGQGWLVRGNG